MTGRYQAGDGGLAKPRDEGSPQDFGPELKLPENERLERWPAEEGFHRKPFKGKRAFILV